MSQTSLVASISLQSVMAALFASFARQYSYGYNSLQELTNSTRQNGFRYEKGNNQ